MSPQPVAASTSGPDLTAAFREATEAMRTLGAGLDEAQWEHPSLCPGWSCKDALVHVTSAEIGFAEWEPSPQAPFDRIRDAGRELSRQPGADVLAAFEAIMARRLEQIGNFSEAELDREGWSPAGIGPHRRYLEIRVFDHWAHEHDIRVPLDLGARIEGLGARTSLDEAHIAFGYLVGKRAGAPDGSSVAVHVTGPLRRDLCAVVEGRARVVDEVEAPTAEVTADFLTFMLLCCGRIDPEGPLGDGRVTLAGDRALADKLARNLAFTI
jgi:uncharacterized protein (TIGR03083 family)